MNKPLHSQLRFQTSLLVAACTLSLPLFGVAAQIEITTVASGASAKQAQAKLDPRTKIQQLEKSVVGTTSQVKSQLGIPAQAKLPVAGAAAVSTSATGATPSKTSATNSGPSQSANAPSIASSKADSPPYKSSRTVNIVGYNRNIKQEHFKDLSKETVLKMQKQLAGIYQLLPDWQRDYALKGEPLNDG
ncbi:MAG: hypothetical protein E6Q34_03605, partial [Burkholderiaceae bacterium]